MIHPTAVIHPGAQLDSTVSVGPYVVIDENVVVGPGCVIGPHVYLTGHTTIGSDNRFHAGCVIGDAPQDVKYDGAPTCLRIGDDNRFREHVTVHRSNQMGEETMIGSHNFLMQHSHVAHNVMLGDNVVLAGGALVAGHVVVEDRAFISGNCLIHQFVRVGTLAMMQGGAAISKDLPPFTMARGYNALCGLNTVGLRRAGYSPAERQELRRLYRALFRCPLPLRAAWEQARGEFTGDAARRLLEFIGASRRGVCAGIPDAAQAEAQPTGKDEGSLSG